MIHAINVELVAEAVGARGAVLHPLELGRRHVVVAIKIDVASDAQVLDAHQLSNMIEMIKQVLNCGRFTVTDEVAHTRDAHDAAGRSHLPNGLVGLASRMSTGESATVRVGDE